MAAYLQAYDHVLPLGAEAMGSVGMDPCLSAPAYGALRVGLHLDERVRLVVNQTGGHPGGAGRDREGKGAVSTDPDAAQSEV